MTCTSSISNQLYCLTFDHQVPPPIPSIILVVMVLLELRHQNNGPVLYLDSRFSFDKGCPPRKRVTTSPCFACSKLLHPQALVGWVTKAHTRDLKRVPSHILPSSRPANKTDQALNNLASQIWQVSSSEQTHTRRY